MILKIILLNKCQLKHLNKKKIIKVINFLELVYQF